MIRRFLDRLFGTDTRSLAAFRVAVGAILLVDLLIRGGSIIDHYSDDGILPRTAWVDATANSWGWSLHAMSGLPAFERMLFAIAAAAAMALTLGWRTRGATVVSWVMLASIQQRNELVVNGGDELLRVLLFWAMFLPLGARWSVDARRKTAAEGQAAPGDDETGRVLGVAGACILLQVLLMYISTGLYKMNDAWSSGDALRRSLSFDMYVKPAGLAMLGHESLLQALSRVLPWVEVVLPAMCLFPVLTRWWRGLAIVVFLGLHIGIELMLATGLFQWVCITGWLLFVPSAWWDRVPGSRRAAAADPAAAPARRSASSYLVDGMLLFLFAYVVFWNVTGLREKLASEPPMAESHRWLGQLTALRQEWDMFSDPPLDGGWYVVTGRNGFGDEINLLTGAKIDARSAQEKPALIHSQYPDHRWRKHMGQSMADAKRSLWPALAATLARRWNREHAEVERINYIELAFMRESTPKAGEEPTPARKFVMYKGVVTE